MSSNTDQFERTKLKKQLTQRKRGKEPTGAIEQNPEEVKTAAPATKKGTPAAPSILYKKWKEYAPTYLAQRPPSKMVFDICFFATSVVLIA